MLEKSCCGGDVLLLTCSGAANVGQIANEAGKALTEQGQAKMYCAVGVGACLDSFIETTRNAAACVAIDGCPMGCVKQVLENAGLEADVYVLVTDLGIEKQPGFDAPDDAVAKVTRAVIDALEGPGCCPDQPSSCCGCGQ
jgi:uncharacterized metal-binding protein